jgi:adenosylcobinamide kinase/adenosylcobinamide-phosphate guanylyltransferase
MPYTFVTGGASSGKSDFAAGLFGPSLEVSFIATGVATDGEMAARIQAHRAQRPAEWQTIEEPLDLTRALDRCDPANGVLVDDLTFWVTNLVYTAGMTDDQVLETARRTASVFGSSARRIVTVTNEVGQSLVPGHEGSRRFRTLAGRVNRTFAADADEAFLVVSGMPVRLK